MSPTPPSPQSLVGQHRSFLLSPLLFQIAAVPLTHPFAPFPHGIGVPSGFFVVHVLSGVSPGLHKPDVHCQSCLQSLPLTRFLHQPRVSQFAQSLVGQHRAFAINGALALLFQNPAAVDSHAVPALPKAIGSPVFPFCLHTLSGVSPGLQLPDAHCQLCLQPLVSTRFLQ